MARSQKTLSRHRRLRYEKQLTNTSPQTPSNMAAAIAPTSLSFPAHTFAKLSPHAFLHANLISSEGTRPCGRKPHQARRVTCTTSSLTHTAGSAVFRIGDTVAVCGIRPEILLVDNIADYKPRADVTIGGPTPKLSAEQKQEKKEDAKTRKEDADEMGRLQLLVPNVDLATGCSPGNLPGGPPSALAQTLSQRILTLLHLSQMIDMRKLRIWYRPLPNNSLEEMDISTGNEGGSTDETRETEPEIKAFWTLYIDILFLSLDGNPFDAAWGSLMAALTDVRLPRTQWNADLETVVCDDDAALFERLIVEGVLTVPLSFGVFTKGDRFKTGERPWILVDMDGFEEGVCEEGGTLVIKRVHKEPSEVIRIEKIGGGAIRLWNFMELVHQADERGHQWHAAIQKAQNRDL